MNYYRRYVGDYLRDTSRLSMLEHGAYNLMLDYYYADEKPLPLDKDELYTMVRAMRPEDKRAVDKVLSLFFVQGHDGYHQKRVDEELRIAKATIAKQRESGAEAAAKRWAKDGLTHTDGDGSTHRSTHRSTDRSEDGLQHTRDDTTTNQNKPPTPNRQKTTGARASRLPSDWTLPEDWRLWAQRECPHWTPQFTTRVADDFRDYWLGAPKGAKVDWLATWRKWVRSSNDPGFKTPAPAADPPWKGAI